MSGGMRSWNINGNTTGSVGRAVEWAGMGLGLRPQRVFGARV